MTTPDFTDHDSVALLTLLAKYAEAYAADHTDPALTVKELCDDLAESNTDALLDGAVQRLRDRVYDGLNNRVGA